MVLRGGPSKSDTTVTLYNRVLAVTALGEDGTDRIPVELVRTGIIQSSYLHWLKSRGRVWWTVRIVSIM